MAMARFSPQFCSMMRKPYSNPFFLANLSTFSGHIGSVKDVAASDSQQSNPKSAADILRRMHLKKSSPSSPLSSIGDEKPKGMLCQEGSIRTQKTIETPDSRRSQNSVSVLQRMRFNSQLGELVKEKKMEECMTLLQRMHDMGVTPNAITYTTLIVGLVRDRQFNHLHSVVQQMKANKASIEPAACETMMSSVLSRKRFEDAVLVLQILCGGGAGPSCFSSVQLSEGVAVSMRSALARRVEYGGDHRDWPMDALLLEACEACLDIMCPNKTEKHTATPPSQSTPPSETVNVEGGGAAVDPPPPPHTHRVATVAGVVSHQTTAGCELRPPSPPPHPTS